MEDEFIKIGITMPGKVENEPEKIVELLDVGFDLIHIRKPDAGSQEIVCLLGQIPMAYRNKIIIHDFHHLASEYSLGGIHINSRNKELPEGCPYSVSCHSIEELEKWGTARYKFLSPVYDSISKPGYRSAFNLKGIRRFIEDRKVVALSGVTLEKIPELKEARFYGAAFMGDLWQNIDKYLK